MSKNRFRGKKKFFNENVIVARDRYCMCVACDAFDKFWDPIVTSELTVRNSLLSEA